MEHLKTQTTSDIAITTTLLRLKGAPHEPIENTHLYLYTILHAILAESNQPPDAASLSPQEAMLLGFCNFVRDCLSGQRDGIAEFYNKGLKAEQRHPNKQQASTKSMENIERCVDNEIQQLLSLTFASDTLLKKLLKAPPTKLVLEQLSHQTLFLKNRFANQLGFIWRQIFDPYSKCVAADLLACTEAIDGSSGQEAKSALEKIIEHVQSAIVQQIQRAVTQAVEAKTIVYQDLDKFFEKVSLDKAKLVGWPAYIQYDENLHPIGITQKGALEILRGLGYVTILSRKCALYD